MKVINNHLGFRNGHSRKQILVSDTAEARSVFGSALFTVFEQNDFSKYDLNDPQQLPVTYRASMARVHSDFGTWLVGDFSHITDEYYGYETSQFMWAVLAPRRDAVGQAGSRQ